jgi:hypothetical protein
VQVTRAGVGAGSVRSGDTIRFQATAEGFIVDMTSARSPGEEPRPTVLELVLSQGSGGARGLLGVLERVCRAATAELQLMGAAVILLPTTNGHVVSAASSQAVRRLEEDQFGLGEGPTRDAYATGRPVFEVDVETLGWRRWPGFTPLASLAGAGAVLAFPLHLGAVRFGVLTLYLGRSGSPSSRDLRLAQDFAQFTTELLVDTSGSRQHEDLDPGLHAVLDTRGEIYQAQGMVMVDLGVSLAEALALMRAHAYATEQDLSVLARDIIAGRTLIPDDEG